jgi:hypothetical protein
MAKKKSKAKKEEIEETAESEETENLEEVVEEIEEEEDLEEMQKFLGDGGGGGIVEIAPDVKPLGGDIPTPVQNLERDVPQISQDENEKSGEEEGAVKYETNIVNYVQATNSSEDYLHSQQAGEDSQMINVRQERIKEQPFRNVPEQIREMDMQTWSRGMVDNVRGNQQSQEESYVTGVQQKGQDYETNQPFEREDLRKKRKRGINI